jgi:UDP-N-acetylglucosamine 2-epimerase
MRPPPRASTRLPQHLRSPAADRIRAARFDIVYYVHLNPNVQQPVLEILSEVPNVYLTAPMDSALRLPDERELPSIDR